ncbi:DUF262 domain-containing protein [Salmonella enterica]|uniref:DUF262 domain-containing protein n=1 Tax=Salmonella enterica TaxID=28901 RepID=A0A748KA61_SALER|nr:MULTISPECIES: DUF262 domain-containing protein [Enterobacteriaceae]EAQ4022180.1 DUF262 domain-containing protein [Salmonella enterica]EBU9020008.1 DUF262 domain-containing protein [Salmonella enterica subsp. enterica serovar Ullevi]EDR7340079.1 DUF262 domain-containing protein [Salmonella enterica subsp. salamae]EDZ6367596.1 DUF262 domain-containing protein [Salmonella enterica subsp. enterica serovar Taksony]MDK8921862.1 DUF262 domain-containing protein [Salmonella enterica subsp. enterica
MNFEELINDIERLLIGKELQSINPNTPPLFLLKIDRDIGKYYVSVSLNAKPTARSISEFEYIFNDLLRKGFCNVDQSLYGSSSSRNHPETIFANLPYIQFFKFKKKKHILLRNKNVHEAGQLSELQGAESRAIRKQIENYLSLNLSEIAEQQLKSLEKMFDAYDAILKKYPGDIPVIMAEQGLLGLKNISEVLINSYVSLDFDSSGDKINKLSKFKQVELFKEDLSLEDLIESPEISGVDSGDKNIEEQSESELAPEQKRTGIAKMLMTTPVLTLIFDRVRYDEIELQPDFQRKDRIWPEDKKSKLIESILMKLPLPGFYFGEKPNGNWVVIDGLQRTTTICDFMSGRFPLKGLSILEHLNGKTFKDLTRTEQRDIREYQITAYQIELNDDSSELVVELFHRINTYGVKLSSQEIRSALNKGNSVTFLRYLASLEIFKKATQYKVKPDRQKDMELCLSALAFMVLGYNNYSQHSYDKFLCSAMQKLNKYPLDILHEEEIDAGTALISPSSEAFITLYSKYNQALILANEVFGEIAFSKDPENKKSPINKQLFELIVTVFSVFDSHQKEMMLANGEKFIDSLYLAIEENSSRYAKWESDTYEKDDRGFRDSISTSTGKRISVVYRFDAFLNILEKSTGIIIDSKLLQGE